MLSKKTEAELWQYMGIFLWSMLSLPLAVGPLPIPSNHTSTSGLLHQLLLLSRIYFLYISAQVIFPHPLGFCQLHLLWQCSLLALLTSGAVVSSSNLILLFSIFWEVLTISIVITVPTVFDKKKTMYAFY